MEESKLENVLGFYYETIKLKEVERSGWNTWNVSRDKRVESIPEHVYGTQQLAFAIYSEFDIDIDIFKVNSMLAYHETEEIILLLHSSKNESVNINLSLKYSNR